MERRGCGLGCVVIVVGLALSCCLLPYLFSSLYSVVSTVLQVPAAPSWLWGDFLNTLPFISESDLAYMVLAEGPICCAGVLALLLIILGAVALIAGLGSGDEAYDDDYEHEYDDDATDDWYDHAGTYEPYP